MDLDDLGSARDYVELALARNPGLNASLSEWRAARARIPQASALDDPRLSVGYFADEVETRVGPQRRRIGIQQTIPLAGKRSLRRERAEDLANAAEAKYDAERLRIQHEVETVYYEYYYVLRTISLTEENILLLKSLEQVAQAGVRAGRPMSAALQAQLEIGALEDELASLRESEGPLVARMNALLNLPTGTRLPRAAILEARSGSPSSMEPNGESVDGNPELESLAHEALGAAAKVALAKKDSFPDITLGLDYIETGEARARGVPDSGSDALIAGVSINLPIWREKYRARVEEAAQQLDAARSDLTNRENVLQSELEHAIFRLEDSERKIRLYRDTLMPLALNTLNVSRKSYESGRADFLEIIGAQRLALEFQRAEERAFVDRQLALSEIETLTGTELQSGANTEEIEE